MPVHQV
jgi:hypothetical protein